MNVEAHATIGGNVTAATKTSFLRQALRAKIGMESAQEVVRRKSGEYRQVLAAAKKAGVNTDALTHYLNVRLKDADEVFRTEYAKAEMLELSGFLPGLRERLSGEADTVTTLDYEHETSLVIAIDRGTCAGMQGAERSDNPYEAGTMQFVRWVEGYMDGQRSIADEMAPANDERPVLHPALAGRMFDDALPAAPTMPV